MRQDVGTRIDGRVWSFASEVAPGAWGFAGMHSLLALEVVFQQPPWWLHQ